MRLLSVFSLVLVFMAVSACIGDNETITVIEREIECSDGKTIVTDPNDCPRIEDSPSNQQPTTSPSDTSDRDDDTTTSSECNYTFKATEKEYTAGSGDEIVCGNEKDNIIRGGKGDDILYGRGGNDTLYGGAHRDILKGEGGNDTLIGGEDLDTLDGGGDTDIVDYSQEVGTQRVTVDLVAGSATDTYGDEDTLISIENIKGTTRVDDIKGDNGPNVIDGNGGEDDMLDGRGGIDTIVVRGPTFNLEDAQNASEGEPNIKNFENIEGKGTETEETDGSITTTYIALTLTGDDKPNTIKGADGGAVGDTINGAGGNDTLYGRRGNDNLNAGTGKNTLTGGLGTDCFSVEPDKMPDTITDFTEGETIKVNITDENPLPDPKQDATNDPKIVSTEVALAVDRGKVVALETYVYDADEDSNTDNVTRRTVLATYTTLIRGLEEDTDIGNGTCP